MKDSDNVSVKTTTVKDTPTASVSTRFMDVEVIARRVDVKFGNTHVVVVNGNFDTRYVYIVHNGIHQKIFLDDILRTTTRVGGSTL